MKVAILGGYGVFGARLAEMLARDGHELIIAGRNLNAARDEAARIGGTALAIERRGDLSPLFALAPEVLIDAAGPFQSYGDDTPAGESSNDFQNDPQSDPWRLPRLCIAQGVDYLDLSDSAAFTQGIEALDADAIAAGRRVLSGASSTPGLSSCAITALTQGMDSIALIDTAIVPGNRAPRGRSVIASILGQIGRPCRVWRGGQWRRQSIWSDRKRYDLGSGLQRFAYLIETPDLALFPSRFGARSVLFRAGLELGIMNASLVMLRRLRQWAPLPLPDWAVDIVRWSAERLKPFGSDRGGMSVTVVGRIQQRSIRRRWRLVAKAGDGPFVPGIVARALLRRFETILPGARPCLAEISLAEIDAALSDLSVTTGVDEADAPPLFASILGADWQALAPEHQRLHEVEDIETFTGSATIIRGPSLLARAIALAFGFPQAGEDVPVRVEKTRAGETEVWRREFGGQIFHSPLSPAAAQQRCIERFGPFAFELSLPVDAAGMRLTVRRGWLFGLPLPRPLLPLSDSREFVEDGVFRFDVALHAPLGGGLVVRYRGWLTPEADGSAAPPGLD